MGVESLPLIGFLVVEKFVSGGSDLNALNASLRGVDLNLPYPIVSYEPWLVRDSLQAPICTPEEIAGFRPQAEQLAASRAASGQCDLTRVEEVATVCLLPPQNNGVFGTGANCSTEIQSPAAPTLEPTMPAPILTSVATYAPNPSTQEQTLLAVVDNEVQFSAQSGASTSSLEATQPTIPPIEPKKSPLGKIAAGLGILLGGFGGFLTIRATIARILRRDEQHSLAHTHGVRISTEDDGRLGIPETHAYVDGNQHIVPQTVPLDRVVGETYRRGRMHSHPDDDHSVHTHEVTEDRHTGFDPLKRFRKETKQLRDDRRQSRDR